MCIIDYDNVIALVLIVFSLFNNDYIYTTFQNRFLNFQSCFSSRHKSYHQGLTYLSKKLSAS